MKTIAEVAERLGLSERMDEVQFLATGFKAVDLEGIAPFKDELQVFDQGANQAIKAKWEARLAKNPTMFAGPLASVQDFEAIGGILKFRLQRSRFDIYDGLREKLPAKMDLEKKPMDRDFCLPLSMGGVTITAPDGQNPTGTIIFGIRSSNTAFGGGSSSTLPAGYFNPDSDRLLIGDPGREKQLLSIRMSVIREMLEEIGIQDYRSLQYLGLIYDGALAKQPLLGVRIFLDFTTEEIKAIAHDIGFEVDRYYFVPNTTEAVRDFISKHPPTPHNLGKLVLHFAEE